MLGGVVAGRGQVLLSDDFAGGTLNSSLWSTVLPVFNSSLTQSGGVVTTVNRGILATQADFAAPYVITGSFTMLESYEHFNIGLRTDLSSDGLLSSYERKGILVSFSNDDEKVSIQRFNTSTDWEILSSASYALTTGQTYSFRITDTGTSITLAVDGVDAISANSMYSTGEHIVFYSREAGSGTQIDAVTISAIPEPSSYAALVAASGLLCALVARHRRPALRR